MTRGFCAIALDNPKSGANIGGAFRAAQNFGASLMVVSGTRAPVRHAADTMKAFRQIPLLRLDDVFDALPFNCVPVAVDIVEGADDLPNYRHPERAFYVFGAEDATLGKRVLSRCRDAIVIPSFRCLNLASSVAVVLYDRTAKRSTTFVHETPGQQVRTRLGGPLTAHVDEGQLGTA